MAAKNNNKPKRRQIPLSPQKALAELSVGAFVIQGTLNLFISGRNDRNSLSVTQQRASCRSPIKGSVRFFVPQNREEEDGFRLRHI